MRRKKIIFALQPRALQGPRRSGRLDVAYPWPDIQSYKAQLHTLYAFVHTAEAYNSILGIQQTSD